MLSESCCAMSRGVTPDAISRITVNSRSDSVSCGGRVDSMPTFDATCVAILGLRYFSPRKTVRMAATSCSGALSLLRYALAPARSMRTLLHSNNSVRASARQLFAFDSSSVVGDRKDRPRPVDALSDAELGSPRMADRVGHGFLDDSEHRRALVRLGLLFESLQQHFAAEAGPRLDVLRQPLDRSAQPHVVEQARTEGAADPAHGLDRGVDPPNHRGVAAHVLVV